MDDIDFTLDGKRYRLTRDAVIRSMRRQIPGRIQTYAVDIDGVRFPVKQVLAQALQIPVTTFVSTRAQDLLAKLEFEVTNVEADRAATDGRAAGAETRELALELAVELYSGRSTGSIDDVLSAAARFEAWLGSQA
jgi:hypothetical protein